ncbi:MAG: hypothetical protein WBD07_18855 [Vicinamibacterales bacterium]
MSLRAGEWVEVRSEAEILATLDNSQSLDGLPFMPEMLQFSGRRFRVYKSAHKTCDTTGSFKLRRMTNAVHLEGLRCDGEAHGGCQAGCLLFWKEAWLRPVAAGQPDVEDVQTGAGHQVDPSRLDTGTRHPVAEGEPQRFRCQATELPTATTATTRRDLFDPRFYVRDLTSGNVNLLDFVRFGVFAAINSFLLRWWGRRYPHLCGLAGKKTPTENLNLQPGELVRVRSKDAIMKTLNVDLRNRGLGFDVEMAAYCEKGEFRVLRRVEKIINEKTGQMMTLPNPCIVMDGVVCSGNYSKNRMFCPRAVYPYFREIWLKRVGEDG